MTITAPTRRLLHGMCLFWAFCAGSHMLGHYQHTWGPGYRVLAVFPALGYAALAYLAAYVWYRTFTRGY